MLKLKLQYFGHLMGRTNSLEKTLIPGKIEGGKGRGRQRMRWLDGITNPMDTSLASPTQWTQSRLWEFGDREGSLVCCCPWGCKESDTTERLHFTSCTCMCFPHSSVGEESACNAGDPGLIPGLGRSPGEGKGYPLQYSGLENFMDCIVHGVTKRWT